jgi:hypothetical protein
MATKLFDSTIISQAQDAVDFIGRREEGRPTARKLP